MCSRSTSVGPRVPGYGRQETVIEKDGAHVLRRLARPLLGATFVASGVEALRDGEQRAHRARALGVRDADTATRALAGAQVGAGLLLGLGRLPRLTSLLLAVTVLPEAATGHAFWSESDKQQRGTQRALFVRDLGLLGGLLVSVADTGGRESVPHRAARTAKGTARTATTTTRRAAKTAKKQAKQLT
jgi:putative oxidoreductase